MKAKSGLPFSSWLAELYATLLHLAPFITNNFHILNRVRLDPIAPVLADLNTDVNTHQMLTGCVRRRDLKALG